jgi:hypothetical protein
MYLEQAEADVGRLSWLDEKVSVISVVEVVTPAADFSQSSHLDSLFVLVFEVIPAVFSIPAVYHLHEMLYSSPSMTQLQYQQNPPYKSIPALKNLPPYSTIAYRIHPNAALKQSINELGARPKGISPSSECSIATGTAL